MHWTWHAAFAEIVCGGMTQDDIETYEAGADAGFTETTAFAPVREGVFNDEPLDD